jgi:hypothetical protein
MMPISEDRALDILAELIKKPESRIEDVPKIWNDIMTIYNQHFHVEMEPVTRKRRKRVSSTRVGWPAGVTRTEYREWKAEQEELGVTENLNPQYYKQLRDRTLSAADAQTTVVLETPRTGRRSK